MFCFARFALSCFVLRCLLRCHWQMHCNASLCFANPMIGFKIEKIIKSIKQLKTCVFIIEAHFPFPDLWKSPRGEVFLNTESEFDFKNKKFLQPGANKLENVVFSFSLGLYFVFRVMLCFALLYFALISNALLCCAVLRCAKPMIGFNMKLIKNISFHN